MECPKCDSTNIERMPPSQISPHPGYCCKNCGLVMRSKGMLFVYLFTLLLGTAIAAVVAYVFLEAEVIDRPIKIIWVGVVGLVVAGYSLLQISRPVPRAGPKTQDSE